MLIEKYKHLRSLCQQHGIKVGGIDDAKKSSAYHDRTRGVEFPPPRSEGDYLAALHEIGHYVVPDGMASAGDPFAHALRFQEEIKASRWALSMALDVTDEGIDFLAEALLTYSEGYGMGYDLEGCRKLLTEGGE